MDNILEWNNDEFMRVSFNYSQTTVTFFLRLAEHC